MKNISWLENFAKQQKEKMDSKKTVKTASKKVATKKTASLSDVDMIIVNKAMLPKAVVGNKVKYRNFMWKVANASYKDSASETKGVGVVLSKIAAIDTKQLTDPETRANTDPGDVYDYNVRETSELVDFQEAEAATAQEIAQEDSVDRTTPAGRYTAPETVVAPVTMGEEIGIEAPAPVVEETPVEDAPADEAPAPVVEEVSVEETAPVEDAPAEEEATAPVAETVVEETPVEDVDDFSFEDVDEEPFEDTDEKEEEKKPEEKPEVAAVKPKQNRIIAAMLKGEK